MKTLTVEQAKKMVGQMGAVVQAVDSDIWGILEYVTADGWAGVRGPKMPGMETGRLDEVQVGRLIIDPT